MTDPTAHPEALPGSRSRLLVNRGGERWRAIDLADVYFVEATGDDCRIRLRSRQTLQDVRRLAELEEILAPAGFLRIHRTYLVNPHRILELRRRREGDGWEVVMEPPVNRVLPVSEERVEGVRGWFL